MGGCGWGQGDKSKEQDVFIMRGRHDCGCLHRASCVTVGLVVSARRHGQLAFHHYHVSPPTASRTNDERCHRNALLSTLPPFPEG